MVIPGVASTSEQNILANVDIGSFILIKFSTAHKFILFYAADKSPN